MITELPCLAHFATDRDNIVTTYAIRTGLETNLKQRENDDTIRPMEFASRFLDDAEKKDSIGELELLAVVWGLEKIRFYLWGKVVHLYIDH